MCHLTLTHQLAELGYQLQVGERLNVYLTDTLEVGDNRDRLSLFAEGKLPKKRNLLFTIKTGSCRSW